MSEDSASKRLRLGTGAYVLPSSVPDYTAYYQQQAIAYAQQRTSSRGTSIPAPPAPPPPSHVLPALVYATEYPQVAQYPPQFYPQPPLGLSGYHLGMDCNVLAQQRLRPNALPCKFYVSRGFCFRGIECTFAHVAMPVDPEAERLRMANQPCKFFLSGNCGRGFQCSFSHGIPPMYAINASAYDFHSPDITGIVPIVAPVLIEPTDVAPIVSDATFDYESNTKYVSIQVVGESISKSDITSPITVTTENNTSPQVVGESISNSDITSPITVTTENNTSPQVVGESISNSDITSPIIVPTENNGNTVDTGKLLETCSSTVVMRVNTTTCSDTTATIMDASHLIMSLSVPDIAC